MCKKRQESESNTENETDPVYPVRDFPELSYEIQRSGVMDGGCMQLANHSILDFIVSITGYQI